jgi:CRP-like cAMP-binding protein
MFLLNNPEQRWQYVQANFPDWEQQLTQKDLASYIGISPVSLSRIRARLNKG